MKPINTLTLEQIVAAGGKKASGLMDLGGRKLYVETCGNIKDPAIALLHGGPGTGCIEMSQLLGPLSVDHFVVTFDQYGVFRSDSIPAGERWGLQEHVELLEQLRCALGLEKWAILGHSYGGMLASYYTHLCPQSISATLYDCPSWDITASMRSAAKYYIDNFFNSHPNAAEGRALAERILTADYTGRPKDVIYDILTLQPMVKDDKAMLYMRNVDMTAYFDLFNQAYRAVDADERAVGVKCMAHVEQLMADPTFFADHSRWIPTNFAPALLMIGLYDPICIPGHIQMFRSCTPRGKAVIMPNSAHYPQLEDREYYIQTITRFLKAVNA